MTTSITDASKVVFVCLVGCVVLFTNSYLLGGPDHEHLSAEKLANQMFVERIGSKYYRLVLGSRYRARNYVG